MLGRWGLGLRAFAEGLRAGGVGTVQWRCKGGTAEEVLAGAKVLREVFAGTGCLLLLNDWVELVERSGLDGVHVGQGDLGPAEARARMGPGKIVGVSTHTEAQVRSAAAGPADYVAVGPVFGTLTKADAEAEIGLEGVRAARRLTDKPLVGIGGISAGNAGAVLEAGADAVAVIGALYRPGSTVEECVAEMLRGMDGHGGR